jgi:mannose-6-phosphate isomerase-like protein (cupin superfamily)
MWEVFFVEAGRGTIANDNCPYSLLEETFIAVEPREIHEIINTGDKDMILTYFALKAQKSNGMP